MTEPQGQAGETVPELALMIPCDRCGQIWLIRRALAGRPARCRDCGGPVRVPGEAQFRQEWNKERLPTPSCYATLRRKGLLTSEVFQAPVLNLNLKGLQICTEEKGLKGSFFLDQLTHRVGERIVYFEEELHVPCRTAWKRAATPKRWKVGLSFDDLRYKQRKGLERFLREMRRRVYPGPHLDR